MNVFLRSAIWFLLLPAVEGCTGRHDSIWGVPHESILEEKLTDPHVARRVIDVQRDFPSDIWAEGLPARPGRHNTSRSARESALAYELLDGVASQFNRMSARQLLKALKTYPYTKPESYAGVAAYLYREGNQMIIKELLGRDNRDLQTLMSFTNRDDMFVFTGDNGPPLTIGGLVRDALRRTNQGRAR